MPSGLSATTILVLALGFPSGALAQSTADCAVEDLAWMAASWSGTDGTVSTTEMWLDPAGGVMLGLHHDVFGPERSFFEFLRIAPDEDGNPTYHASPMGRTATPFRLTECRPLRAVFENPAHDYPQRIVYERENDTLVARIEGSEEGERKSSEWRWSRRDRESDRRELLRLHEVEKTAHLGKNAELLVSLFADDFASMDGGEIRSPTPGEHLERFSRYFDSVEFLAWEDITPPKIRISEDGTLAHVIVHKRVRLHPVGNPADETHTVFAWLETWEKRDGEWKLTTVASTERPGEEAP